MDNVEYKIKLLAELIQREAREVNMIKHPNLPAEYFTVKVVPGNKYIKIDLDSGAGCSGKLMIDGEGNIFGIKGYGVPNKKKQYGTLDTINNYFWGNYYPVERITGERVKS